MSAFPVELQDLNACELEAKRRARSRLEGGDRFLIPELQPLSPGADDLQACLGSEAMGDHAGVNFVQAGHGRLLEEGGLLPPQFRLDGCRPVPYAPRCEWLCIDDYIFIGRIPMSQHLPVPLSDLGGADLEAFDQALKIYDQAGLLGAVNREKD